MRLRPYRTMDDKIDGVVVTFVDITERRQAEESLRINERRLQLAREASDLGILDYAPATGECWLDERARALWGFSERVKVSMELFWSRLHPDDLAEAKAAFAGALASGGDEPLPPSSASAPILPANAGFAATARHSWQRTGVSTVWSSQSRMSATGWPGRPARICCSANCRTG